jgi:hypothetical protein
MAWLVPNTSRVVGWTTPSVIYASTAWPNGTHHQLHPAQPTHTIHTQHNTCTPRRCPKLDVHPWTQHTQHFSSFTFHSPAHGFTPSPFEPPIPAASAPAPLCMHRSHLVLQPRALSHGYHAVFARLTKPYPSLLGCLHVTTLTWAPPAFVASGAWRRSWTPGSACSSACFIRWMRLHVCTTLRHGGSPWNEAKMLAPPLLIVRGRTSSDNAGQIDGLPSPRCMRDTSLIRIYPPP